MEHKLPEMPYAYDALEPFIDARTMEIHHLKHHQAYVNKLNAALKDHPDLQDIAAPELLKNLDLMPERILTAVRNHGGGHANHSFFWPLLKKGVPAAGPAVIAIKRRFGTMEGFREAFKASALGVFGSGWTWLVRHISGDLEIMATPNQDTPLSSGLTPIIGLDVWEHAYYLKYQSRRAEYIEAFFSVINWERANAHFEADAV